MQTIHINLVSEQLLPNLIPTFADVNCHGVVLVVSDNTLSEKADNLARLYQRRGLSILKISEGCSSHRPQKLYQQAQELIDWLATYHSDKQWMLNATCGTKPMSLVFSNTFNRFNREHPDSDINGIPRALIVYTDTQNHELPLLNEGVDFALPWRSVMNLDDMLAANGFECSHLVDSNNDAEVQERSDLTRYLGKQFQGACQYFLGPLQHAATEAALHSAHSAELRDKPNKEAQSLCLRLQDAGLLKWDEAQSKSLLFTDKDACRYLAGQWLEELTYLTAQECGFEQVAMSVEGLWQSAAFRQDNERGKNNEFDVLICHNNQLLTIECKAKHWGNQVSGESTNQDVVLKLESLGRKLGGAFGERLLVSARPLPDEMIQRAQDNRIKHCDRADGKAIRNALQRYFARMQ